MNLKAWDDLMEISVAVHPIKWTSVNLSTYKFARNTFAHSETRVHLSLDRNVPYKAILQVTDNCV